MGLSDFSVANLKMKNKQQSSRQSTKNPSLLTMLLLNSNELLIKARYCLFNMENFDFIEHITLTAD